MKNKISKDVASELKSAFRSASEANLCGDQELAPSINSEVACKIIDAFAETDIKPYQSAGVIYPHSLFNLNDYLTLKNCSESELSLRIVNISRIVENNDEGYVYTIRDLYYRQTKVTSDLSGYRLTQRYDFEKNVAGVRIEARTYFIMDKQEIVARRVVLTVDGIFTANLSERQAIVICGALELIIMPPDFAAEESQA